MSIDDESIGTLAAIAEEAYAYLFPLVLMDVTRRISTNGPREARPGTGPANRFAHRRAFPPGDFKEVVRPNYDTLYSPLWFELRDEPIVVSVPDTGGRYYMLPMLDMWTDVFAVLGSRTTGTREGAYALVGPGWAGSLPSGVERIDAPTPQGWIIGRTQTNGPADYAAVNAIQDGFVATPLSEWPGPPSSPQSHVEDAADMATPPLQQVMAMSGAEFMARGAELMTIHPPHVADQPMLARMRRLGWRTGAPFLGDDAPAQVREAVGGAPMAAHARMDAALPRLAPIVNGWSMMTSGIGVYGADYLRRAVVAKLGLGANLAADAVYPVAYLDANGEPPSGDNDYVLRFEPGELPPAGAFWSVTMYDGEGFPVPNALDRYAIGDRDSLVVGADGSVELHLRHADPGEALRANWLPAPRGPIGVTLRIYAPGQSVLDGSWAPPPLKPLT